MNNEYYITRYCSIRNKTIILNNKKELVEENFVNFAAFIKALYKKEQLSYPKFYKMDNLSKLGFLTAELVLKESSVLKDYSKEEIGIVISNSTASLDTDLAYQETIRDKSNYFPSPSVFVYTLPNILIGEICIRHQVKGENAFLVSEKFDPWLIENYVMNLFNQGRMKACICGWVDLLGEHYDSVLFQVERFEGDPGQTRIKEDSLIFNTVNLYQLYNKTGI
jgi:hypothetical protein